MSDYSALQNLMKHIVSIGPTGCALSVTRHGKKLFEEYVGYSDKESAIPIGPDTIYRIYSMTKVITVTAALMLYERGLYLLDDPLKEYMPEFSDMQVCSHDTDGRMMVRPSKNPIRIRDLFCMTTGFTEGFIPGYDISETEKGLLDYYRLVNEKKYSLSEAMPLLARVPLAFEPGTHWRYGDPNHDIIGALIEVLSGKTFGQYLKDEIFEPLGMNNTYFRIPEEKKPNLCGMYTRNEDGVLSECMQWQNGFDMNDRYESGSGAFSPLCTLHDFSVFADAMASGRERGGVRLLCRKTIELMATNHLTVEQLQDFRNMPKRRGYGYGLGVRTMIDRASGGSNSSVGEFGWGGAGGTWVMIDPKEGLSAVYMQQLCPSKSEYIQPRLRAVIYASV